MRELVAATTERDLFVDGVGTFRVPVPTVRVGLTVLRAKEDEPSDEEAFREVCADWLPLPTYSVLFSRRFTDSKRLDVIRSFVVGGMAERLQARLREERKEAAEGEGAPNTPSGPAYWQARLAQYRAHFGLRFEDVMQEPFPAFVAQLGQLSRLEAREQRRMAEGAMMGRVGDEDVYESLTKRARFPGLDEEDEPDVEPEWEGEQEKKKWLQKKMRKVADLKQAGHRGQNDLQ